MFEVRLRRAWRLPGYRGSRSLECGRLVIPNRWRVCPECFWSSADWRHSKNVICTKNSVCRKLDYLRSNKSNINNSSGEPVDLFLTTLVVCTRVHVPCMPSGPNDPALHLQSDSAVLATLLLPELARHTLKSPSTSWLVTSRYLPDVHLSQPVCPVFA